MSQAEKIFAKGTKLGDLDDLSSDTDTENVLHGQQRLEGLEFDDELESFSPVHHRASIADRKHKNFSDVKSNVPSITVSNETTQLTSPVNSSSANTNISHTTTHSSSEFDESKIPSLAQVYDLASTVGHVIDPLSTEISPEKFEKLTQNILPILALLESTTKLCQRLSQNQINLQNENTLLHNKIKEQIATFEANEFEYLNTVNNLSEQLEHFQKNMSGAGANDGDEWDFGNSVSHVEENLAMALKEAQNKIQELKLKEEERKKQEEQEDLQRRTSVTQKSKAMSREPTTNMSISELNQIIELKNHYKQKCFSLEDEIKFLKGEEPEVLIQSPNKTRSSAKVAAAPSFLSTFTNFANRNVSLAKNNDPVDTGLTTRKPSSAVANTTQTVTRSMSTFFGKLSSSIKREIVEPAVINEQ